MKKYWRKHQDLSQRKCMISNKPWFDDECSKLTDQRKQTKLQWLQSANKINSDNLQNVRHKTIGIFRNKEREYLKGKINELETNNKKNFRD
jgi:hypothetical protein